MELSSLFSYSKVDYTSSHKIHLLVSAKAPKLSITDRVPLNLILAIDVSGSMYGDKIEYVKKSVSKLVEHLTDQDRLGIITFNGSVREILEPMFMTTQNRNKALSEVGRLHASGNTNMSLALHRGIEWGNKLEKYRLIFLTDGQPTSGETNKAAIRKIAQSLCIEGSSITSFGYGNDHDPEFLSVLANENKGNYAYIKNPDDALTAFALELGGLLSCYGQQLEFRITPKEGVKVSKVVSDVDVEEEGSVVKVSVPEIYSEAMQHIVLEVEIPKQDSALPRAVTLFDVELSYLEAHTGAKKTESSKAKINFVKAKDADKAPIKEVMAEVALAQLMEAQAAAEAAAERGDFLGAFDRFRDSGVDTSYLDSAAMDHYEVVLSSVSSAAAYDQEKYGMKATKSAFKNSARGASAGGKSLRMGASGMSATQTAFVSAFTSSEPGNPPVVTFEPDPVAVPPVLGTVTASAVEDNKLSKKRSEGRW